ncbi:hypothetical protein JNB_14468 [Janibacter sp. HTCC2649]|uniref:DUF2461 domain-containing protein n=1 Tax=Janibacter sp. HTCC2649 TaxID=313589 RepID=UPI000067184E|nr:DUF2461 domain-containing protein [Janibacter sp. HTCC2649]EAP98176.1 hypothetical protein JNB_14468 [Janibacter sp. HTCC2649]
MTRSPSTDSADPSPADAADVPGIPLDAVEFYRELEESNSREWWAANKLRYAVSVQEPLAHLGDVLTEEFGEPKMFRPNRDVRFSKDKSPYKTHQGLFVPTLSAMGWYVQVGADGLRTAGGFYASQSDQVARYRASVQNDVAGQQLVDLVDTLLDSGFDIGGDLLATRPRGIPADHPRLELLRHRTLTAARDHGTPDWFESDEVVERVREDWVAMRPLIEWCEQYVGASEKPGRF